MTLTGIVIPFGADDLDEQEKEVDEMNGFLEKLDAISDQYSCGQEDGTFFIASDDPRILKELRLKFPNEPLVQLNLEEYSWDKLHFDA